MDERITLGGAAEFPYDSVYFKAQVKLPWTTDTVEYFHTIPSILKQYYIETVNEALVVFPYDSVYFKAQL